jgi:glycosyltransferase involved in cell wall biosynthesis
VLLRLRGDPFAETRDQLRFHFRHRRWADLSRVLVAALLDRPLFTVIDRFIPVSHWIVRRLHLEHRSAVVRIPVDVADFPARTHENEPERLKMLAVTNFNYPSKVAALGRFLDAHGAWLQTEGWEVVIAGAGDSLERFHANHAGHAQFLGFVGNVAELYAQADVFVHFSDLDAFPYVVLEAQASGLPVVVNRDCGMLEQVDHRRTGCIVDLEQSADVRVLFRELKSSRETREQLGTAGREHVERTYALARIGRDLAELCT